MIWLIFLLCIYVSIFSIIIYDIIKDKNYLLGIILTLLALIPIIITISIITYNYE